MNTFGTLFRITTFGESHGPAIGGIIDGMPAGMSLDIDALQAYVNRRSPGRSAVATQRREPDSVELLSGIGPDGVTLGTPIGFMVRNSDCRPQDYEAMRHTFRPSHADYTYQAKYGVRDHRGGGRASARETVARVVAGAIAYQALQRYGIEICAFTRCIGPVRYDISPADYAGVSNADVYASDLRCPDEATAQRMRRLLAEVQADGDSVGGIVSAVIKGVPAGFGEPVFGKFSAALAAAMMSIGAAKGFEYGMGFDGACSRGSQVIDPFTIDDGGAVVTSSNHSGGVQGGITNGMDVTFSVAFKPVATLRRPVDTITDSGEHVTLSVGGRHDVCVVPRAVAVVDAMAAIVTLDALLLSRASRI